MYFNCFKMQRGQLFQWHLDCCFCHHCHLICCPPRSASTRAIYFKVQSVKAYLKPPGLWEKAVWKKMCIYHTFSYTHLPAFVLYLKGIWQMKMSCFLSITHLLQLDLFAQAQITTLRVSIKLFPGFGMLKNLMMEKYIRWRGKWKLNKPIISLIFSH